MSLRIATASGQEDRALEHRAVAGPSSMVLRSSGSYARIVRLDMGHESAASPTQGVARMPDPWGWDSSG